MTKDTYPEGKDKPFDFNYNSQVISLEVLLRYHHLGFKLVPIGIDSKHLPLNPPTKYMKTLIIGHQIRFTRA